MNENGTQGMTRRQVLKAAGTAGAVAMGVGANILIPGRARAAKQLRILQWTNPVRTYDAWFGTFTREWGRQNDTEVTIDHRSVTSIEPAVIDDITGEHGHDLVLAPHPVAAYEDRLLDMADVYQECTRRHGKPVDLAVQSTFNPRTGKYYAFCDAYVPFVVNYRKDLWDEVGMVPDTWEHIRQGGARIKKKTQHPIGIGISSDGDSANALLAILYSFGGAVQNEHGEVVLNSPQTLEALKFVKAMYKEAMTSTELYWDPSSNNASMLGGRGSLAINPISITRVAESRHNPLSDKIWLAGAPRGPVRAVLPADAGWYVIPKSATNAEGAKTFLLHFIDHSQEVLNASQFFALPAFPSTVPDLAKVLTHDDRAHPADKYAVLADASRWAVNQSYPGYSNAAFADVFNAWVLNGMFSRVAQGQEKPEDALKAADAECKRIFAKWRAKGLV